MSNALKVTFMLRDTHETYVRLVNEGETVPHKRRVVTITLTPEQMGLLRHRRVGSDKGQPVYEEITECWIENEPFAATARGRETGE